MKRLLAALAALLLLWAALPSAAAEPAPLLSLGSSGEEVRALQRRLIDAGFLSGPADGQYGKQTRLAVIALQEALRALGHPLAVDGIAGPETRRLMGDEQAMAPLMELKTGSSGPRVTELQNRLIDLNFLRDGADGLYGTKTRAAVEAFQALLADRGVEGIAVTGAADLLTRRALYSDLSGMGIQAPPFFDDARPLSLTDDFLYAPACALVDADSGETLFEKNGSRLMYPASTTKIMTLLVALESGIPLDRRVTVPACAAEVPKDSSLVPLSPGEAMSFRDLLYALMIRSGNDAANAVAEIAAGSVEAFVGQMNRRAGELGLHGTRYVNPHGYHDPGHYSTAADLARLTRLALKDERFLRIVSALEYTLAPTHLRGPLPLRNGTELLDPLSPYFFEGAFGVKKGYTSSAGFCYAGAARRGGKTLVAVVMGGRERFRAWTDMGRLFNFGFASSGLSPAP